MIKDLEIQKRMSKSESATIGVNPTKSSIEGEALISDNPNNSNDINKNKNRKPTISANPNNKQKHGKGFTSDNPKHTSKVNVNNREVDDDEY